MFLGEGPEPFGQIIADPYEAMGNGIFAIANINRAVLQIDRRPIKSPEFRVWPYPCENGNCQSRNNSRIGCFLYSCYVFHREDARLFRLLSGKLNISDRILEGVAPT